MGCDDPGEDHWIPYADLMSGLAVIFLLIALVGLRAPDDPPVSKAGPEEAKADMSASLRADLYQRLQREFAADWSTWHAHLSTDLTIRFEDAALLFDTGQSVVKPRFAAVLAQFVPRYLALLTQAPFSTAITELRIEGHSSSAWQGEPDAIAAYRNNMLLSQERSRATLLALWDAPAIAPYRGWLAQRLVAAGLSSSKPIRNSQGIEDAAASQRVAFCLRLTAGPADRAVVEARRQP